jgi:hypothetical protein
MIGVATRLAEQDVVKEFFELFKTPWEFHRGGRRYDVLLCTRDEVPDSAATVVLIYRADSHLPDAEPGHAVKARNGGTLLEYAGGRIPIYGKCATFPARQGIAVLDARTREPVVFLKRGKGRLEVRIGYDLFEEVRLVLALGQPAANAGMATLELHIKLLRELIARSGIPVVEIPPVPEGFNFMACLTHDIDHPVLRNHCCDHTMFGFAYRATFGTFVQVCRGRKTFADLWKNCAAALKTPLVYLGMAKDFWSQFDRYLEMEAGLGSTYFVIPRRDDPGRSVNGKDVARRAARYSVADVREQLERILSAGNEVGVHGIDAWLDSTKGREERECVNRTLKGVGDGVRMHWLFFSEQSPATLEKAGFDYDSTVGFGETVGYRAGTTQAYKPLNAENLLELPLHVMDTSLFYPCYLNLAEADAEPLIGALMDGVAEFGGVLTINWHDRSISPERLWGGFYLKLLEELKRRGAWFPTAAQAVSWFRKRRSAILETEAGADGSIKVKASVRSDGRLPGLRVRVHKPRSWDEREPAPDRSGAAFVDLVFNESIQTEVRP